MGVARGWSHHVTGGVELESVEVKVKLKDDSAIADLLPKQVSMTLLAPPSLPHPLANRDA